MIIILQKLLGIFLLHNDPLIYENINSLAKEINCFKTGEINFYGNVEFC